MIYQVINPSDGCTIEAPTDALAAVVVILLSTGRYGCRREDGVELPSMVAFSTSDHEKLAALGVTYGALSEWVSDHAADLAPVFDSLIYERTAESRAEVVARFAHLSGEALREQLFDYNDEKRSSMNDINRAAAYWAERCREIAAAGGST